MHAIIRRKHGCDSAIIPTQCHQTDVGYDVCAYENTAVKIGEIALISTGLIVEPPERYYFEVALRSSMPRKKGLLMPHGFGVIDPKYCGPDDELKILVYKFGRGSEDTGAISTRIVAGERIAQLILRKAYYFKWENKTGEEFTADTRGGFGSTGGAPK